jgi:3-oxoacyl-[acyl-carrier protein] reductase
MNKRIIITGGSRGIGAACVRAFCENGDKVFFVYGSNTAAAQAVANETGAIPYQADLADISKAHEAIQAGINALGGVDVLVNCAGISQIELFTELTDADWQRMISVNLSAVFATSQEALREMVKQHSGKIINVGSIWGARGAACEAHYSATKSGLRGLTSSLAKEFGPSGITVNLVEPGVIDTDMNGELDKETFDYLIDRTPLCRIGKPSEVANVVAFLASEKADFITGAFIPVDGGFPA